MISSTEDRIKGTHKKGFTNNCNVLIRALLFALVVIIPLAVYPAALDQALAVKYLLLKIFAIILIGLFIIKIVTSGATIRMSGLEWLATIFLLLVAISTMFTTHLQTSLEGAHLRYDGVYSYLIYVGLFFLIVQSIRENDHLERFAETAVMAAGVVSVYGIVQRFGFDPIPWGYSGFDTARSFATFGNPVLLGGYLSIMLPVSVAFLLRGNVAGKTALYTATTGTIALCVMLTMGRAAWIGILSGLVVMAFIFVKKGNSEVRLFIKPLVLGSLVGLVSLSVLGVSTLTSRATSIFRGYDNTRLSMWKSAIEMISDRPFFGFGPDTLGLVFSKYELKEMAIMFPYSIQDNVHNAYLQMAATTGIPALITFLLIIALTVFKTLRYIRAEDETPSVVTIGLLGGVVAFSVQGITGITGIATSTFLWIALGALASSWSKEGKHIGPVSGIACYAITGIAIVIVAAGITSSFGPFLGDVALAQARLAHKAGDIVSAQQFYKKAIKYSKNDYKAYQELGMLLAGIGESERNAKTWSRGIAYLKDAARLSPHEQRNQSALGQAYIYGARTFDPEHYPAAEKYAKSTLELRPNSYLARLMLGIIYLDTGRLRQAEDNLSISIEINPNNAQAHYHMGRYYEKSGEIRKAESEYLIASKVNGGDDRAKDAYERLMKSEGK